MAHDGIPHLWIIDEAQGRYSWGYCQVPGCEDSRRQFDNQVLQEEWPGSRERKNGDTNEADAVNSE